MNSIQQMKSMRKCKEIFELMMVIKATTRETTRALNMMSEAIEGLINFGRVYLITS